MEKNILIANSKNWEIKLVRKFPVEREKNLCVFGGDTCVPPDENKSFPYLLGDAYKVLNRAALTIINLEGPITNSTMKVRKIGPHLYSKHTLCEEFMETGIDAVALANNHIMDYGESGLNDTLKSLKNAGISFFGASNNMTESLKPLLLPFLGTQIAIMGLAEEEFSSASLTDAGAAPLDTVACWEHLVKNQGEKTLKVVIVHAGLELTPIPPPFLRNFCRTLALLGVDLIVCQHSHIIGAVEVFENAAIIYGQGNFIFPKTHTSDVTDFCVLAAVDSSFSSRNTLFLCPYYREDDGRLIYTTQQQFSYLSNLMLDYSSLIKNNTRFFNAWSDIGSRLSKQYIEKVLGFSRFERFLNRTGFLTRLFKTNSRIDRLYNCIATDSHRDTLISSLKALRNRTKDSNI